MAGGRPPSFISFTCPNCQALYHVVKVEAGPETTEAEVTCRACGAPFPGRDSSSNTLCCATERAVGAVDRPRPENVPRRQFSARPKPLCAQAAPDCWRCSGHQGGGVDAVLRPLPTKMRSADLGMPQNRQRGTGSGLGGRCLA